MDIAKICVPSLLILVFMKAGITNQDIPTVSNTVFAQWTKHAVQHWHPWTANLFYDPSTRLIPYAAITISAIAIDSRSKDVEKVKHETGLAQAIAVMTLIAIAGVAGSELLNSATITKIAAFRITKFALILAIPIFASAIISQKTSIKPFSPKARPIKLCQEYFVKLCAMLYVIACLANQYLWPYILFIGAVIMLLENYWGELKCNSPRLIMLGNLLGIGSIMYLFHLYIFNKSIGLAARNTENLKILLLCGTCLLIGMYAISVYTKEKARSISTKKQNGMIYIAALLLWVTIFPLGRLRFHKKIYAHGDPNYQIEKKKAYLDIQKCAKRKLSASALVMQPLEKYGWRSGSERMTTGSARNWSVIWMYSSNKNTFDEGKKRLELMGMSSWLEFEHSPRGHGGIHKFFSDMNIILEHLTYQDLNHLAGKLNATHLVIDKERKNIRTNDGQPRVCDNDFYAISPVKFSGSLE